MDKHCCRCWRCVDEHEINICAECTLEELQLRVACKGIAFISVSDYEVKGGEDPRWN